MTGGRAWLWFLASLAITGVVTLVLWAVFDLPVFFGFLFLPFFFAFGRGRRRRSEGPAERVLVCPRCGLRATDPEAQFCPRDGTRLE